MVRWSMRAFRKRSPLREQMESHTIRASESRHTNRMPESEFSHSAALASAAIIHGKEFYIQSQRVSVVGVPFVVALRAGVEDRAAFISRS